MKIFNKAKINNSIIKYFNLYSHCSDIELISYYTKKIIFLNIQCKSIQYQDMLQRKDRLFYKTHTTDIEYYKVMKEFQVEAEGTPINSEKYIRLRNKYHRKLAMQPSETNKYNETPNQIDYLRFYIAVCPELLECYQLIIILNYNKVLYKAVRYIKSIL